MTGVAATILLGDTAHKAMHLNQESIKPEQLGNLIDTRLLVIDQISFAAPEIISNIDENLRVLLGKQTARYGGMNIVFARDLRQLKAVNQPSIIDNCCEEIDKWVNCFIELLEGKYRFDKDPEWGEVLIRFRNGVQKLEDFTSINDRVVTDEPVIPLNIKYHKLQCRKRCNECSSI